MRSAYRVLAYLIATGVVIQAAAIAYAWFAVIDKIDGGAVLDENWEGNAGHAVHGIVGISAIPLLALILLVVSFFAKVPNGVKWAGGIFALVVAQVLVAFISFGAPGLGVLHGIFALALFAVAFMASHRVVTTPRTPVATSAGATVQ